MAQHEPLTRDQIAATLKDSTGSTPPTTSAPKATRTNASPIYSPTSTP